jgi:hypothetical protein
MKTVKLSLVLLLSVFLSSLAHAAQGKDVTREEINQMKQEIQELKALVGDLKTVIKEQKQTIANLGEVQRRQEATAEEREPAGGDAAAHRTAEKAEHALEDMVKSIKPNISATGDFLANLADDSYMNDDDRFDLRGVDIDFSGEIDNVARAYFNLSYHDDDVNLEEGYLEIFDLLPAKTDVKLGKYRVNFGLLNTIHPHALPQVDYPAIYRAYLGEEGYIDEGIGIGGSFPSLWKSPFHYTLQAVNGNRHDHTDEDEAHGHEAGDDVSERLKDFNDIVYVGRLWNEIKRSDDFGANWGLSGLTGRFDEDSHSPRYYLEGVDLSFIWYRCPGKNNRVRWQSEVFFSQVDNGSRENAYGLYSFLDYAFAPRWLAGVRYDYAQLPLNSDDSVTEYSAYLTHQFSKNIQIRLQYEHQDSSYAKDSDYLWLQWVFTLGKHTHLDKDEH